MARFCVRDRSENPAEEARAKRAPIRGIATESPARAWAKEGARDTPKKKV